MKQFTLLLSILLMVLTSPALADGKIFLRGNAQAIPFASIHVEAQRYLPEASLGPTVWDSDFIRTNSALDLSQAEVIYPWTQVHTGIHKAWVYLLVIYQDGRRLWVKNSYSTYDSWGLCTIRTRNLISGKDEATRIKLSTVARIEIKSRRTQQAPKNRHVIEHKGKLRWFYDAQIRIEYTDPNTQTEKDVSCSELREWTPSYVITRHGERIEVASRLRSIGWEDFVHYDDRDDRFNIEEFVERSRKGNSDVTLLLFDASEERVARILKERAGYVIHNGEWVTQERKTELESLAGGLVKYNGKWMSPAERDRRIRTSSERDRTLEERPRAEGDPRFEVRVERRTNPFVLIVAIVVAGCLGVVGGVFIRRKRRH